MPRGARDDNGSETHEGRTFDTLKDEGYHFVHVKQHDKAIESFTQALEMKPDDEHCLVTRSKCHLQLGNAEAALTDAEAALGLNPKLIKGFFQKAEALYQCGNFETALVFYHRGHRLRPELQEFRLGIQKSQEAINNSIGSPDSVKLSATKGDMSYFYKQEEQAKKQTKGTYSKPIAKKEEKKEREHPKGPADLKTIKQLLGELYGDKEYLEKLLKDQSLTGHKNDMSRDIKDKVCDGLDYLHARADFWRQQKPMYARKRDKERQMRALRRHEHRTKGEMDRILRNLEEIDDAQTAERYQESLDKARHTLKLVENSSDDEIQNKPELIASLHSSIGNAYLELGKINQAMDHHEKDLDIAREYNLEDARSRALDNLGRVFARKGDFEKAIETWQEKVPLSKSPLESTWLYHEIGRCYLELDKYADARDYGEKSLQAAKEADDEGWQLHASVLVAQSEVKLGDYQAASDSFERSLEMARRQNDTAAELAIHKALEEVNEKIVRGEQADEDKEEVEIGEDKYAEDTFETDRDEQEEVTKGGHEGEEQTDVSKKERSRTPSPEPQTVEEEQEPTKG